jgi:hypothetical protein
MLISAFLHITNDNKLTKKLIDFVKIKLHSNTLNKTQIQFF